MKRSVWFLVIVLLVPGFSHAQRPKPQTQPRGYSQERLARIAPVMKQLLSEGKFPGMSVTIAKDSKIIYDEVFGYADLEKKEALKKDTIYRIYSMSKPVTSVAVMILLEEGRFQLDDPVSKYLPCFKNFQVFESEGETGLKLVKTNREVTVRDLLRQTSGLSYGGSSDSISKIYRAKNLFDPATTLEQMVEKVCTLPLYFQPGTKWEYGVSIDVLGRLVEVLSGESLDVFMKQRIFDPLKMSDTGFFVPDEKRARFANCYAYSTEKGLSALPVARAFYSYEKGKNKMLSGGGGLVSTASDYLRFALMLANGGELEGARILSPKTVSLMSSNQLPDGVKPASWGGKNDGNGYGFAVSVLTDIAKSTGYGSIGDFGWDGAASTFFRIDPEENLVILLMTQRMPADLEIQVKLKTLVYQALLSR